MPIASYPKTAVNYYELAEKKEEEQDFQKAIQYYSKAIELSPNEPHTYYRRGNCRYKIGNYEEALKDYNKLISLSSRDKKEFYLEAVAYSITREGVQEHDNGDYREAITSFNNALEYDPGYFNAYERRGDSWYQLGSYNNAIADYSKAIELFNDSYYQTKYHLKRSMAHLKNNNSESANSDLIKITEFGIYTSKSEAYKSRGDEFSFLDDYELAIEDYNKSIELDPDNPAAYYSRGISVLKLGQRESACKDFHVAQHIGYAKASEKIKENCEE